MTSDGKVRRALAGDRSLLVTRSVGLDDVRVLSRAQGGDGRTVEAYAAVFSTPAEIMDEDGHYLEQNARTCFDKSVAERGGQVFCVYNHARSLGGAPSDLWSVPLGKPVHIQADEHGLLTRTRFNADPEAERILEAIRSGSLTGMSYTGVFLRSDPALEGPFSRYGPDPKGKLPLVTRQEIALIEYGPTPIPAYETAQVMGVRTAMTDARFFSETATAGGPWNISWAGGQPQVERITLVSPVAESAVTQDSRAGQSTGGGGDEAPAAGEGQLPHPAAGSTGRGAAAGLSAEHERTAGDTLQDMVENAPEDTPEDAPEDRVRESQQSRADAETIGADEPDDSHTRAASVDNSSWDGPAAMSGCASSDTPASAYRAICAGRRAGDPSKQSSWALPHHKHPGDAPNAAGVRNALARLPQTQGLTNRSAAESHLRAHMSAIQSASGGGSDSSSSGRNPDEGTPRSSHAEPHSHPAPYSKGRAMEGENRSMTVAERQERQTQVRMRLLEIDREYTGAELPADVREEWIALQSELVANERAIQDASERAEYLKAVVENDPEGGQVSEGFTEAVDGSRAGYLPSPPAPRAVPPTRSAGYHPAQSRGPQLLRHQQPLWDLTEIRQRARSYDELPMLYRDHAMRAVELAAFPGVKNREEAQSNVSRLLDGVDDLQGTLAQRVIVTGSPTYERAFGKMLKSLSVNGLTFEESRALSLGTDAAGGYAVPFQLDPTVILTFNGVVNPLRQISRVESITGKEWDGVTSAGITVSRVAEGTEASDANPQFAQPTVRTTRVQGFVPFSIEIDMTWGAMRGQLTRMLTEAKDVEEAASFVTGSGTAPAANGVVNTLSTASRVATAGTAAIAIADLYSMENNAAPTFRQTSSWLASKTTYNRVRQLFTAQAAMAGDPYVRATAGTPASLFGYPAYEASSMTTSTASGALPILFGDFSQFLIVDRVGMGIELIPHLFGSVNRFPTGQRGILAIWFNNSKILADNAFRLMVVT